ncbi:hypothetical protein P280DRAFT_464729 [Massarina eburnea CBS 473.64]|uniref:Uncharacterized protein n=1 Tax=Massarina eburnea CBS 473.64 TaxID=1395130 RepID=A0A6A6SGS2_9PLEO|nr:hypothetical protein P280DRAFT_464729 [Massarina eburnea CBS 473.64]
MQFSVILSTLVAGVALAAPISDIEKRDIGISLCKDVNFANCFQSTQPSTTCVPLAQDWNDSTSSINLDAGILCYFFVNPDCDTTVDFFHTEVAVPDLSKTPVNGPDGSTRDYSKKISSYRCSDS